MVRNPTPLQYAALFRDLARDKASSVFAPHGSWVDLKPHGEGQDTLHPPEEVAKNMRKVYGYVLKNTKTGSKGTTTPWQLQVVVRVCWNSESGEQRHAYTRVNAYSSQFAPVKARHNEVFHVAEGDAVTGVLDWQAGSPWSVQIAGWDIVDPRLWHFRAPLTYIPFEDCSLDQTELYHLPQLGGYHMGPTPATSNPPWIRLVVPDWDFAHVRSAVDKYGSHVQAFRRLNEGGISFEASQDTPFGPHPPPPPATDDEVVVRPSRGGWKGKDGKKSAAGKGKPSFHYGKGPVIFPNLPVSIPEDNVTVVDNESPPQSGSEPEPPVQEELPAVPRYTAPRVSQLNVQLERLAAGIDPHVATPEFPHNTIPDSPRRSVPAPELPRPSLPPPPLRHSLATAMDPSFAHIQPMNPHLAAAMRPPPPKCPAPRRTTVQSVAPPENVRDDQSYCVEYDVYSWNEDDWESHAQVSNTWGAAPSSLDVEVATEGGNSQAETRHSTTSEVVYHLPLMRDEKP